MSYSSEKQYEVFLSFRGEDTRTNFTSHLYDALNEKSIKTFKDDQSLEKGQDTWPAISKAIEESEISVVVFSENYASSTWCLKELVKILECRKEHGQIIIPVFYNIDPTHIRKQTGSYKNALAHHEIIYGDKDERVSRWRDALEEAANITGHDSRNHIDESQVIKNVVNDVLQKLQLRYPIELKGLVGTEKIWNNVEPLLKEFRIIGIWGMGGIGKTTIAKFLFAKLFSQYDHVCFVANAKEYSLDKLLFELLKEEISSSNNVAEYSRFGMRRLSGKKVLIVLDDVVSRDALEYLYREYDNDYLGQDSKLIITTRNKQLLVGRVDRIYQVKKWRNPESLELFCLQAFMKIHPEKGYELLAERAVDYAGGVPLALQVLGSSLYSKRMEIWESYLGKLANYANKAVQNVLKVSYDGLDDDSVKKIFLDIAFFFRGIKKDRVTRTLDASNFYASSGIEALEDKALITISNSNRIQMHDLLQQMAFEIVRQEYNADPRKRSRLRDNEALEVIKENKGSATIEGIALDLSLIEDLPLRADTFAKMKNLRFLRLYASQGQSSRNTYLSLPTVLKSFSDKLRYIEWFGYPFMSLPQSFYAKFLVEIHMPHSKVESLWEGEQKLDHLEGMDLRECKWFKKLPDLSWAPRLKWVNLRGCESLEDLHPSLLSSDTLITLLLDRCTKLTRVKGEKHLKSLEKITVNGCSSLMEFEVSSDFIQNLDLSKTRIQTLHPLIGGLHNLKWLSLEGLKLKNIIVKELTCLKSLNVLKLSDTDVAFPENELRELFDVLQSLEILHLKNCSNLIEIPYTIGILSRLRELRLDGSNVKSLPYSIKHLHQLEILSLENCKELILLPDIPPFIEKVCATNCTNLFMVSNLDTLATKMKGRAKRISFKNCSMLDRYALKGIMDSLHLTMMSAAFDNSVRQYGGLNVHNYNYTRVELCLPPLPGRDRVPRLARNRTNESSITIEISSHSNLIGFIYSVVLSPVEGIMKKHTTKIECICHAEGGFETNTWHDVDIAELYSDQLYVWYDPLHCDSILEFNEPKVGFKFRVANDKGDNDDSICIKECGVHLIRTVSELHKILPELREYQDKDPRKLLEKLKLEAFTSTDERSKSDEEEENNGMIRSQIMQNQQRDLDSEPESEIVEPDSSEEGNMRKDNTSELEGSMKHSSAESTNAIDKGALTKESQQGIDPLRSLWNKAMDIIDPIQLDMDPLVIGKAVAIPFYICQKDVLELVMGREIVCVSVLQLWLMYLDNLCYTMGSTDIYGFIDPIHIQSIGSNQSSIQKYIQNCICEGKKQCYLAPYLHKNHWQLIIICPRQNFVVFLCSVWEQPNKEIMNLVNLAMDAYSLLDHTHLSTIEKTTWLVPCSRRQIKSAECGYYVMRHMLNIVWTNNIILWKERLENSEPFPQSEIDNVRRRWATYFMEVANL